MVLNMPSTKKAGYTLIFALVSGSAHVCLSRHSLQLPSLPQGVAFLVCAAILACGMEYYARYAHQHLWHRSLWSVHASHHVNKSENDLFELNDLFGALSCASVVPVIAWAYLTPPSFFTMTLGGAAVGISIFGTGYILVHDGLHHGRFPVGPLAHVPALVRVADAHGKHHSKGMGPPFGLFLGEEELRAQAGGRPPAPIPGWLKCGLLSVAASIVASGIAGW